MNYSLNTLWNHMVACITVCVSNTTHHHLLLHLHTELGLSNPNIGTVFTLQVINPCSIKLK